MQEPRKLRTEELTTFHTKVSRHVRKLSGKTLLRTSTPTFFKRAQA